MRYALVDDNGAVVNVVTWNGETTWTPPPGLKAIRDDSGDAEPHGTFDGKLFQRRVKPAPEVREPSETERRLADLEAKVASFSENT